MSELPPESDPAPTTDVLRAAVGLCAGAVALVVLAVAAQFAGWLPAVGAGVGCAAAGGMVVWAAGIVLRHQRRQWVRPTRELRQHLEEIRAGREAIGELWGVKGGVAELVPVLTAVLYDLRRQELENAHLDAEMSQRVANRTEAMERALAALRGQAERDSMTGLYNRRALDHALPRVLEQCRGAGVELCVVMVDLDRFKSVNDTLGHQAGDALIADVGGLIRSAVRQSDLAFRYGGDEFVILLPNTSREAARGLAERLVALGGQLGRTVDVRPAPGLSAGVALLSECRAGVTPAELLEAADRALYTTKGARKSA